MLVALNSLPDNKGIIATYLHVHASVSVIETGNAAEKEERYIYNYQSVKNVKTR